MSIYEARGPQNDPGTNPDPPGPGDGPGRAGFVELRIVSLFQLREALISLSVVVGTAVPGDFPHFLPLLPFRPPLEMNERRKRVPSRVEVR